MIFTSHRGVPLFEPVPVQGPDDVKGCGFGCRAFSLIEILAVLLIAGVLITLVLPVLNGPDRDVSKSAYAMADVFNQARTYAMTQNTYVYAGIAEVDASAPRETDPQVASGVSPYGRVVLAVVASRNGTRGYDALLYDGSGTPGGANTWLGNYNAGAGLVPINKVTLFENLHLADFGTPPQSGALNRPQVSSTADFSYNIGSAACGVQTPFDWPLGRAIGSGKYQFKKVVQFDPQGIARMQSASNTDQIGRWIEVDLQSSHGNRIPPNPSNQNIGNHAVVQINCVTGDIRIYRP
ncbi:MAG: Tfp pilus assembly protein FimT/FimU [Chthoniobacteraceae bacterium]